ncbi:hypothetical protein EUX98_g5075 [Antrodiella citrinella]|uniref:Major facilitator superfamily (MFS) profile domain-containing protein n=1 Tax=Antrodiella citrinella TaxID=2447956 RepID=A0A4S4MV85_9APHY|nr:hypothetical protein EUX98_g5075 [Antrodiella citrinella]
MNLSASSEKRALEKHEHDREQQAVAPPPSEPMSRMQAILLTTCVTLSVTLVSTAIASTAIGLPVTGVKLGIEEDQLQWLLSAYALSSGCLLIPAGRLADLYGRRKVFIIGCVFQGAFSLGCGFAGDLITISILRGFQGIGGACTIPASLGILAHAFPPGQARSVAFATFSAGWPMGAAIGFLLGGTLAQVTATTWRTMYWVVTGLSALCIGLAFLYVPSDRPTTEIDKRVDWLGAALVTCGLILVVFVLSDGETAPDQWRTAYIIALLIIGVFLVALFLVWQWHLERPEVRKVYSRWTPPPLMKLSLWKRGSGRLASLLVVIFCLNAGFQSWILWIVLYFQNYEHLTPVLTMIRMIPMIPSGVACNSIIALIVGRVQGMYLIAFGCLSTGVAAILFAVINPNAPYWAFAFPSAILTVVGSDFVFAGGTLFVAKLALPHEQSLAGGLFQTMSMLGQAFGLAITNIVFDRVRATKSAEMGVIIDRVGLNAPRPAQLKAYRAAAWTIAGFAFFAAVLAVTFLRGAGILGGPHAEPEDPQQMTEATAIEESPAGTPGRRSPTKQ